MTAILSVITPVYNGEAFIERCYATLKNQTYMHWEWVVVNDGSTDETLALVEDIGDPRIVIVSYEKNEGRGFARTRALEVATGDWVVIWDADDLYFTDRLERIAYARLQSYDFFCSYVVVMDNDMSIKGVRGFSMPVSKGLTEAFVHHTLGCRRDIAQEVGYGVKYRAGEDTTMILTLAARYRGLFYEDVLTVYQEEREVGLEKAIESNRNQLRQVRLAQSRGVIGGASKGYFFLFLKWYTKLVALYLMRLWPSLYMRTIGFRSYGKRAFGWELSQDRKRQYEKLVSLARTYKRK